MSSTPSRAVAVCFAVPDESQLLRAALDKRRAAPTGRRSLPTVYGELAGVPVAVIHTGVGDTRAGREHVARALAEAIPPVRVVVGAGYAGGLHPGLAVGNLVLGVNRSTPTLLRDARGWLSAENPRAGGLHTARATVETAGEKAVLHQSTGALAVDMESAWVAEVCAAARLPLLSLRVISDAASQDFPVPGRVLYDTASQRPRYVALPLWLATHPGRIAPFREFVRGLGPARERLTRALRTVIARL